MISISAIFVTILADNLYNCPWTVKIREGEICRIFARGPMTLPEITACGNIAIAPFSKLFYSVMGRFFILKISLLIFEGSFFAVFIDCVDVGNDLTVRELIYVRFMNFSRIIIKLLRILNQFFYFFVHFVPENFVLQPVFGQFHGSCFVGLTLVGV